MAKEMTKEQVLDKVSKMPKIYKKWNKVIDKKGRTWLIEQTIIESWYTPDYFKKIMTSEVKKQEKQEKKEPDLDWLA